jgi:hypothetical protein
MVEGHQNPAEIENRRCLMILDELSYKVREEEGGHVIITAMLPPQTVRADKTHGITEIDRERLKQELRKYFQEKLYGDIMNSVEEIRLCALSIPGFEQYTQTLLEEVSKIRKACGDWP